MKTSQTAQEVIEELGTDLSAGLTEQQVKERTERYGYNELQEVKKDSLLKRFLLQFTDPLIIVLILAALISIIVDPGEWIDSLIIVIVVLFNAILGVVQENNAEKSLEALKKMSAPRGTEKSDSVPGADRRGRCAAGSRRFYSQRRPDCRIL